MRHACHCKCHNIVDDTNRADGVDLRDPLCAVSACAECQGHHAIALSDVAEASGESTVSSYEPTDNGEGPYLAPKPWTEEDGG